MPDDTTTPLAYSVRTFARRLALSDRTVRRMIARGDLATLRVGCAVRIPASEADRLLASASHGEGAARP
jgi:excisionase family DNA binding protein